MLHNQLIRTTRSRIPGVQALVVSDEKMEPEEVVMTGPVVDGVGLPVLIIRLSVLEEVPVVVVVVG